MVTKKGLLPVGIERDGKSHRMFELRPRLVRDSVEAMEDPRCRENDSYAGLFILSRQIMKLGEIPKDEITPGLLLDLFEDDLVTLNRASEEVARELKTFRGEVEAS